MFYEFTFTIIIKRLKFWDNSYICIEISVRSSHFMLSQLEYQVWKFNAICPFSLV